MKLRDITNQIDTGTMLLCNIDISSKEQKLATIRKDTYGIVVMYTSGGYHRSLLFEYDAEISYLNDNWFQVISSTGENCHIELFEYKNISRKDLTMFN